MTIPGKPFARIFTTEYLLQPAGRGATSGVTEPDRMVLTHD
jgi:hypothetical protein